MPSAKEIAWHVDCSRCQRSVLGSILFATGGVTHRAIVTQCNNRTSSHFYIWWENLAQGLPKDCFIRNEDDEVQAINSPEQYRQTKRYLFNKDRKNTPTQAPDYDFEKDKAILTGGNKI